MAGSRARRLLTGWPARILLAAAAAVLLWAATRLRLPPALPVREAGFWAVVGLGTLCAGLALRRAPRPAAAQMLAALWLAGPVWAVAEWLLHERQRSALLAAGDAAEPSALALGRRFLVGYSDPDAVGRLAARGLIAGVFVTRRNLAAGEGAAAALRAEIAGLQSLRAAAGLPPLIVATDQEGGIVSRLSPPLPPAPPLSAFAALPAGERERSAERHGREQGDALAGLGITVNFAPVLDLRRPEGDIPGDRLSRIAARAISDDPEAVGAVGLAYARGLAAAGIAATAKHFPGLGRVGIDTHLGPASLDASRALLEAEDWPPFRRVLSGSGTWLMLGHAVLRTLDPDRPTSASARVVGDLLRRDWGFDGVLVTDDLSMAAALDRGVCAAALDTLEAGVDLLLVAYDHEQFVPMMACALQAAREGRLDPIASLPGR